MAEFLMIKAMEGEIMKTLDVLMVCLLFGIVISLQTINLGKLNDRVDSLERIEQRLKDLNSRIPDSTISKA